MLPSLPGGPKFPCPGAMLKCHSLLDKLYLLRKMSHSSKVKLQAARCVLQLCLQLLCTQVIISSFSYIHTLHISFYVRICLSIYLRIGTHTFKPHVESRVVDPHCLNYLLCSLVPRPLPLRGRGSGDIRAISWANKMAARRNVSAPIRLQNYGDVTQL